MLAWLTGAITLLKMLPDLMSAVNQVMQAFREYKDKQQRAELLKQFNDAMKESLKNKDTKTLEDLLSGKLDPNKPKP
jgi:heme exporter protein D